MKLPATSVRYPDMSQKWSVLRTKPNSDLIASTALTIRGYSCFQPKIKLAGFQRKFVPLFPGYVFVRNATDSTHWSNIRDVPGVMGWLKFDELIASIPDEIIQKLKDRVEKINIKGTILKKFQKGEIVRVNSGKFESLAEVQNSPKPTGSTIHVLLAFMGQMISTEVQIKDVDAVSGDVIDQFKMRGKRRTRGKQRWIHGFGPRAADY